MHLTTRNVNTAFRELVETFYCGWHGSKQVVVKRPSRNGNVLMIDEPVTVTYTHPKERVLFNAARDANPFFGLYEQLWMLAGRNDVAPLAYYASKMRDFSDDGVTLNGAYGHRWRNPQHVNIEGKRSRDQLDIIVNHLKADPNSRRAVLQMWNVEDDLLKISTRPGGTAKVGGDTYQQVDTQPSKDVCCNLSVMFSIRTAPEQYGGQMEVVHEEKYLDITVTNRSNDLVWGMLGQDFITFSILQEYMAARLGVEIGRYHHFTNNLHVYDWNWKPDEWLNAPAADENVYDVMKTVPLVKDPVAFEEELPHAVNIFAGDTDKALRFEEPFLEHVFKPAMAAFRYHKRGQTKDVATGFASNIRADDWRIACTNWLQRRVKA